MSNTKHSPFWAFIAGGLIVVIVAVFIIFVLPQVKRALYGSEYDTKSISMVNSFDSLQLTKITIYSEEGFADVSQPTSADQPLYFSTRLDREEFIKMIDDNFDNDDYTVVFLRSKEHYEYCVQKVWIQSKQNSSEFIISLVDTQFDNGKFKKAVYRIENMFGSVIGSGSVEEQTAILPKIYIRNDDALDSVYQGKKYGLNCDLKDLQLFYDDFYFYNTQTDGNILTVTFDEDKFHGIQQGDGDWELYNALKGANIIIKFYENDNSLRTDNTVVFSVEQTDNNA